MKAIILAGGLGTRLSEETEIKPKPMVEIGGKPILWHIMKIYSAHGINDFIICCGYKGYLIKEYFNNYYLHQSDITFNIKDNNIKIHQSKTEPWTVTLVDTGENTLTGGRIKKIFDYIKDDKEFCLTYGDGVGDINISSLIDFHRKHGKKATLTAMQPPGRYGLLKLGSDNVVEHFQEKPEGDGGWINGGFFVLSPDIIKYITGNQSNLESDVLTKLAKDNQLFAFKHDGFWQPMDTMRDKVNLNNLWAKGNAPWKIWK
jgi:glucose-1-phosphate cytidylyltransferase